MYPTFNLLFDFIIKDFKNHKTYLGDKRLTKFEKRVLEAYCLIRSNKNKEAVEHIYGKSPINLYFSGHKELVLGIAKNNTGDFEEAQIHLEFSLEIFEEMSSSFVFYSLVNLFTLFSNMGNIEVAIRFYERIKCLAKDEVRSTSVKKRVEFSYFILTGNYKEAFRLLDVLLEDIESFPPSERPIIFIDMFNLGIKTKNFKVCESSLVFLKKVKKFQLTENFKFMSSLLSFLLEGKPVYLRYEDLESVPVLADQTMTIKYLSQGDRCQASRYWARLAESAPNTYGENFAYFGGASVFSLCLEKVNMSRVKWNIVIEPSDSKMERLHKIFKSIGKSPIKKDTLYELVYDSGPLDKEDYAKLSKLVYKFKNKTGIEVKTYLDSYIVDIKNQAG